MMCGTCPPSTLQRRRAGEPPWVRYLKRCERIIGLRGGAVGAQGEGTRGVGREPDLVPGTWAECEWCCYAAANGGATDGSSLVQQRFVEQRTSGHLAQAICGHH
jgi:hypothetical protein